MLIQKVFHVRQPLEEAQVRLTSFQTMARRIWNPGGFARFGGERNVWDVVSMIGGPDSLELEFLPTDDEHQVLFHSTGGEVELCGLMELLPVRDRLTEVQLTLEYEIQSPLRRLLDRLLGVMHRRVDRQILDMKRQMDADGGHESTAQLAPSRCIPAPPSSVVGEPHPAH